MAKSVPFYLTVYCRKARGGKRPLWHARKEGSPFIGAGNTADNATKDLQAIIRESSRLDKSK